MKQKLTRRTLGKTLKIYRARPFSGRDFFLWYLPGVLLALGFVAYGVWRQYLGYTQFGQTPGQSWGRPWFLLATLSLIPLTLFLLRHVRSQRIGVSLNQNGLRFLNLSREHNYLFWTQIVGISAQKVRYHLFGKTLSERHSALIYPTNGKAIYLPERLQNLPDLVQQIENRVYPLLLPEMTSRLQEGQWLHFGPIRFNKSQIFLKNHDLPWQQVDDIRVVSGSLQVSSRQNTRFQIECGKIPNLDLLMRIIESEISVPA